MLLVDIKGHLALVLRLGVVYWLWLLDELLALGWKLRLVHVGTALGAIIEALHYGAILLANKMLLLHLVQTVIESWRLLKVAT